MFCEESNALVSPTKNLNRDVAPIGDDIEPVVESRAGVEMGNEEDEEPLGAEIPRNEEDGKRSEDVPMETRNEEQMVDRHAVPRDAVIQHVGVLK